MPEIFLHMFISSCTCRKYSYMCRNVSCTHLFLPACVRNIPTYMSFLPACAGNVPAHIYACAGSIPAHVYCMCRKFSCMSLPFLHWCAGNTLAHIYCLPAHTQHVWEHFFSTHIYSSYICRSMPAQMYSCS